MRLLTLVTSLLSVASTAVTKRAVTPGTLSQVTNFDAPTNAGFFIYVPKKLASSPGIIVAIHYCTGTGQAYYQQTSYKTLAEQYGFIVIYPSSPNEGKCWDVSSTKSLTHNGGGDSNTIANMVKWTLKEYNANAKKVFVTGSSSGAMMTNVMAAAYPDMFAAASVYSGVPAGCFKSPSGAVDAWNSDCAHGRVTNTPAGWAKIVQAMDPGYSGARPKMLVYHGSADTTLYPPNYQETMKEWAGVFGYNYDKPQSVQQNTPLSGYTKTTWGPNVVGVYAAGVGHTVPVRENDDMKWFGFA